MTTTCPRAFFELDGSGSGHPRRSSGVTRSGSGTALPLVLGHLEPGVGEVRDLVVRREGPAEVRTTHQPAQGRVADRGLPCELQHLLLLQALADVADEGDDDVV